METRPPQVAVEVEVIPDTGKRPVPLRFRSRAEVRELTAAITAAYGLLPDDGLPVDGVVDAEIIGWSLAELVEAIAPMSRSQLRHVIGDAHEHAPFAVENAIILAGRRDDTWTKGDGSVAGDKAAPAGACTAVAEHSGVACSLPPGHDGRHSNGRHPAVVWGPGMTEPEPPAAALERSISEGVPLIVEDDELEDVQLSCPARHPASGEPCSVRGVHDEHAYVPFSFGALGPRITWPVGEDEPKCACGHAEDLHTLIIDPGAPDHGTRGPCTGLLVRNMDGCPCRMYAEFTPEPDEAAVLGAGELAAAEVDEARSRERRSDSAVTGDDERSVSDEVRAGMLEQMRQRPGRPHGGGRAQMAAQDALDEQVVDACIAAGIAPEAHDPDGDRDEPLLPVSFLPLSHEYLMGRPASAGATA